MDAVCAHVPDLRRQGRGELALNEEIPGLVISTVEILRESHRADTRQICSRGSLRRRLDNAPGDIREGGQWNAVRQRHLRGPIRVGNAGVADELEIGRASCRE